MGLLSWLTGKKPADAEPEKPASADPAEAKRDLETFRAMVESRNGAARVDGARALLERWRAGDGEAATILVDRLPALLEDSEPTVRQVALGCVRLMRKPENLEKYASDVLAALADKAAPVRTAAVWAAIRLPGEVGRTQVRALLTAGDEPLRFDAATALAEVGDSAALPVLCEQLREGHRRQEALSSLMSLGDKAALPALVELWESEEEIGDFDRTMLAAALVRFGDERGAAHLAERAGTAADDRPVAVEWAGRLGVRDAIPALLQLVDQEADPARGAALRALGRLKAEGVEELLLRTAQDADLADDLRMDAAEGLAELGTDRALATLRDLSAQQDDVGALCRDLLGEIAAAAAAQAHRDD
jgi:HEAT repeat protein